MKLLDLTLTISESIPCFPDSPKVQFLSWSNMKENGYNLELLFLSSHTGTHLDAPYHFAEKGKKIDEIPIKRLIGKGIIIKLCKKRNDSITKQDIILFEKQNGKIEENSSVFFFCDWQKNLQKENYFTENPGLSNPAANYLILKKVNLIGIDSPSIDPGKNKSYKVHHVLAKKNILIVENLANLDKIQSLKFDFVILPLKLKNATGSPVRAIALL